MTTGTALLVLGAALLVFVAYATKVVVGFLAERWFDRRDRRLAGKCPTCGGSIKNGRPARPSIGTPTS